MRRSGMKTLCAAFLGLALMGTGCGDSHDDDHGGGNEEEVITTVILTFTPAAGGTAVVATFNDADGEGGTPPVIDPVMLKAGTYTLAVKFENRLETPAEDITTEVRDEGDEHQIFLLGTAVSGPASTQATAPLAHSYADMDADGLPIGLTNTITATPGMGSLKLVLRHLPPVNNAAVKVAMLAETVRAGGLAAIGGSSDVDVDFAVTVTP